jgi:undecaprenyl pyrophosphate phosphatase UppP
MRSVYISSVVRLLKVMLVVCVPIAVVGLLLNKIDTLNRGLGTVVSIGILFALLVVGYLSGRRVD